MKIVAITGSIGCGKTTLAHLVRDLGYTVYDADGWVRRLYYQKDFIAAVGRQFPEVIENGKVNKRRLRDIVFSDNSRLKVLEALVHPFLKQMFKKLKKRNAGYDDLFFIDVALLFEMGWDKFCDYVIVADVAYELQKQRVMKRDNISSEDFEKINKVQMSNEAKKQFADAVINTDKPLNLLKASLLCVISEIEDC